MIYIRERGLDADDPEYPAMAGTRIRHEFPRDDVMVVRIEHAKQTFRGHRRTESFVVPLQGEPEWGDDHWERCMDVAVKLTGEHPLIVKD